jgi:hypothetical protein
MIGMPALLRIASIVSLVLAAGHTFGGMGSWSPPGETAVLEAMKSFRFDAAGASRTYWDFYIGFGFSISVYLFAQAVLLWQLATLAKRDVVQVRAIVAVFLLSVIAIAVLSWKYFFVIPLILSIAIAVCLALALASARFLAAREEARR